MTASSREKSTLIIGAGVFGASTAYHLSLHSPKPSRITVIDKHPPFADLAASTDINKIIRADYSSPFYADLAYEAMQAWVEWPELKNYYHRTGWIMLDTKDSDLADRIRVVFKVRKHDPTEDVSLEDVERRWKGILKGTDLRGFGKAYWNPEAGWCEASAATKSVMDAAIARGVRYGVGEAERLVVGNGKVKGVRMRDGREFYADQVVLATGVWTSSLLSPLEDELNIEEEADRVEQQASAAGVSVVHYKLSASEMGQLSEMPVVVYGEHGEVIPPPKPNRLLKFTNSKTFKNTIVTKSGRSISVPSEREQYSVPEALKREAFTSTSSKVMPTFTVDKEAEYWRLCWDAYTPTQDWLLSRHPDCRLSNLYLAMGGSFHSYKFLPTIGKYMANVLNGNGNGLDKDRAWGWKDPDLKQRGAHEATAPKRELVDVEDATSHGLVSKL